MFTNARIYLTPIIYFIIMEHSNRSAVYPKDITNITTLLK